MTSSCRDKDGAWSFLRTLLLPVDACFAGVPVLVLKTAGAEKKIRNGAALPVRDVPDGEYRVYGMDKTFLALGRAVGGRLTTVSWQRVRT